jgi:hypothetical protein
MKKFYYSLIAILAVPVILILLSNSTGSPGGRTGSIGDNGNTCTGCHTGTATNKFGWITTNVPLQGYTPGQTYTITATGTHTGVVKFGFELTVEDNQGNKVGTLQLTDPARTKFTNGNHAVTHTAAGNIPSGNTSSWSMNWIAPSGTSGSIGIYAAFNAANGNGNTGGDVIYKCSTYLSEYDPVPYLVSIVPDSALQGETVTAIVTAADSRFTLNEPVIFLNNNENPDETILASSIHVLDDYTAEAVINVPVNASPGFWDFNVDEMKLEKSFTVLLTAGITNHILDGMQIYPNPANVLFIAENARGGQLSVYRTNGELMINMMINNDRQEVNISSLSRGLYLVKVQSEGIIRVEKLIVN